MLVVEGDAEDAADLLGAVLVLRREGDAMALVDELQDAEEVFLEEDGDGQDGAGAEAGLLVPALIEAEVGVELGELRGVVGVADVDGLPRQGREAGDGGE